MLQFRKKTRTKVLLFACLLLGGSLFYLFPELTQLSSLGEFIEANASGPDLSAAGAPLQHPIAETAAIALQKEDASWMLTPRAGYRIMARVLHSKQYDDRQASLSPVDLALGWGMLSEPRIDDWISWDQDNRWYYYRYRRVLSVPFPRDYVREHSANVHIIPATENVEAILRELRGNEIVELEGLLVDVEGHVDGGSVAFRTSLSRDDEGDESCEIMYVERVVKDGVAYE